MQLGMDPETLESEAQSLEAEAMEFAARIDARKEAVLALPWSGAAREAFIEMFTTMREQFRGVEDTITGVGTGLRGSKEAFVQTDTGIAAGINGTSSA